VPYIDIWKAARIGAAADADRFRRPSAARSSGQAILRVSANAGSNWTHPTAASTSAARQSTDGRQRHPELAGNTVSRELPGPFALVSDDATDAGEGTARPSQIPSPKLRPCSPAVLGDNNPGDL
jgi:hypothetical protein